ncbi:MAG: hypothetical protein HC848_06165 [Limnobacter sp.]|nr:hypothetical protein [Limnobacter sp.]
MFALLSNSVWIEVAEEVGFRREIASDVGVVLTSPLLVGALLLCGLVNLVVVVGFRPLEKLATLIARREPYDLTPIQLTPAPTEIQPVVAELNQLFKRIRDMLARERRFVDSAAHELRTPLAALSLHAENWASAGNEEERSVSAAQLLTGLSRAKRLVEQMLTYSRIQSEADGEQPTEINLSEELRYLVQQKRTLLEGLGLGIELQLPDASVVVNAKSSMLEILLRNLLDNACKYCLPVKPIVGIELWVSNQACIHSEWTLRFSNACEPLVQADLARLFEPYFRVTGTHGTGNGLGLAMVAEIASLHGWALGVEQTPEGAENAQCIIRFTVQGKVA